MRVINMTAVLGVVLTTSAGCRSVECPAWYKDTWRGFPYQDAKEHLNYYRNVILVCITEDHGEQGETEVGGVKRDGGYVHHYKATVVRSYKGNCNVSDHVAFAKGYCPCGGKHQVTSNAFVGKLEFLLVEDSIRPNVEFGIDPADTDRYDPQTDRLFKHILGGTPD